MRTQHFAVVTRLILLALFLSHSSQAQQIRIATIFPAAFQVRVELEEQLKARYPQLQTTKKTFKDICKSGSLPATITIQSSDLSLYTDSREGTCMGRWKDGQLKFACSRILKPEERAPRGEKINLVQLQKGDKVFPTGIFPQEDFVYIGLASCSGPQKNTLGILGFSFQFPKGYLLTASADDVEKVMSEFFTRDGMVQQQLIKEGQTIDEVVTALGQPQEKLKAGNKEIYLYKDSKVTFVDGRVSSMEQNTNADSSGKQ
jgi:hypothetical protein